MMSRLVAWLMRVLGLVTVSDVADYFEFDAQMTALGVEDRDEVMRMAAAMAQMGLSTAELADIALRIARSNPGRFECSQCADKMRSAV
jgi:hypothetical protein